MKTAKRALMAITFIISAACSLHKKNALSVVSPVPATTTSTAATFLVARSANGIYDPGNEELTAIQAQYKDVTLDRLKEGYILYTQGACINCHGAMNIYQRGEAQWKGIIEDMAQKANISDVQKDAVYKYVLAIKAVQPK